MQEKKTGKGQKEKKEKKEKVVSEEQKAKQELLKKAKKASELHNLNPICANQAMADASKKLKWASDLKGNMEKLSAPE